MESKYITSLSLGIQYGVLKICEVDLEQRKLVIGKVTDVSSSVVLVTKEPELIGDKVDKLLNKIEGNQEVELDDTHVSDISVFYTLEEFEKLNYKAMNYIEKMFQNIKFIQNLNYKSKDIAYRFQRGGSSRCSSRSGYKTRMVNRNKIHSCSFDLTIRGLLHYTGSLTSKAYQRLCWAETNF